jgi:large subunit ribosomal protein L10
MAITRDKKQDLVAKVSEILADAKAVAFAHYQGLSVADVQSLRAKAREAGVQIVVVKNRLVRVAMSQNNTFKDTATDALKGQLIYAFSTEDEVLPSKVLHDFAKANPALALAGGFSAEGAALSDGDVKELAGLPSKDQLVAEVVAQLLSPVHDTTNALSGNLHALLDGIEAKATN